MQNVLGSRQVEVFEFRPGCWFAGWLSSVLSRFLSWTLVNNWV